VSRIEDRFNDDYDPEPDYDRPTLADEIYGQGYPPTEKEHKTVSDPTESIRREMIATGQPAADLAVNEEATWTTEELSRDFEVLGFQAPFVVVRRRSDGKKGSLEFTHSPRVYFGWSEA